jgi:hypothetical protein
VLMTGSALIGGYATGLPVQMPMIDIQGSAPAAARSHVEMGGAACRSGSAGAQPVRCAMGAAAPSRPLRCQPHPRAAGRRPLSAARCAWMSKAPGAHRSPRRRATRSRSQGGGRRHCPIWCAG